MDERATQSLMLNKFPSFDPVWSAEVQLAWFEGFDRLLDIVAEHNRERERLAHLQVIEEQIAEIDLIVRPSSEGDDVRQECALFILKHGPQDDLRLLAKEMTKRVREMHDLRFRTVSLDERLNHDSEGRFAEQLVSN
jgi:hypothetical protein